MASCYSCSRGGNRPPRYCRKLSSPQVHRKGPQRVITETRSSCSSPRNERVDRFGGVAGAEPVLLQCRKPSGCVRFGRECCWLGTPIEPYAGNERLEPIVNAFPVCIRRP